jgi:hypothetical protein
MVDLFNRKKAPAIKKIRINYCLTVSYFTYIYWLIRPTFTKNNYITND